MVDGNLYMLPTQQRQALTSGQAGKTSVSYFSNLHDTLASLLLGHATPTNGCGQLFPQNGWGQPDSSLGTFTTPTMAGT
jgi:hypothetical protein|uniref:Uncharacterized protein n=1 Tax=Picea glauca TaxID=3330 RepID=A0A101LUE8_PICGL|nr:hypothetical protein ABT39_MTgene2642 [Picea glauca]QHR88099.1 hypothetical protein Q903MT_gene2112 [Picea sitchensis]